MSTDKPDVAKMDLATFLEYMILGDGCQIAFEGHDGWPEYKAIMARYEEVKAELAALVRDREMFGTADEWVPVEVLTQRDRARQELTAANAEIESLRQSLRDEFAAGAEYQRQAAIAQAEAERHARGAKEYREQLDAVKAELGLLGGGDGRTVAQHVADLKAELARANAASLSLDIKRGLYAIIHGDNGATAHEVHVAWAWLKSQGIKP